MRIDASTYLKASSINLCFLIAGLVIGLAFVPRVETIVHAAHDQAGLATSPATPQATSPSAVPANPKVTSVDPAMQAGSIGAYILLSHHVQADELVVNGFDILKLQNAELQLLSRFTSPADIHSAVESSRASEMYQVRPPPAAPANPQSPPK